MNVNFNKTLDRRTILKGLGVSLALPHLDIMAATKSSTPKRMMFIYSPNGYYQPNVLPKKTGKNWDLPFSLTPLKDIKKDVLYISGLDRIRALGTGVHAQAACTWLTSSPPSETLDGGFPTNKTLDQMIAGKIGRQTMLPSLEMSTNDHKDNRETKYFETVSWNGPGYSVNPEKEPRAVFNRLFGKNQDRQVRMSILDTVLENAKSLRKKLGKEDQQKIDEYFSSVRGTERRIQLAEIINKKYQKSPVAEPKSVPQHRLEYLKTMADLAILAFVQDRTRVASMLIDPERWDAPRTYHGEFDDKPQNHHALTHTKGDEAKEKWSMIDRYHVNFYAEVVKKIKATKDSRGSLLDNTLVVMGSGMSDGSSHDYGELQVFMAGYKNILKSGEFMEIKNKPLANLWLSLANLHGCDLKEFADSTGGLSEIFV